MKALSEYLNESSKYKGYLSGDVIDEIIKEFSYYNVTKSEQRLYKDKIILSVGDPKNQNIVIKMFKDLYKIEAKPYDSSKRYIVVPTDTVIY